MIDTEDDGVDAWVLPEARRLERLERWFNLEVKLRERAARIEEHDKRGEEGTPACV